MVSKGERVTKDHDSTTLAVREGGKLAPVSLAPRSWDEAMSFAKFMADSDLVPKDFKGKPANVMLAIQMGAEVGLAPMAAIQSIAVINGRPSVYGEALLGIVRASGLLEDFEETYDAATKTATCMMKRRGDKRAVVKTFSWADAENVIQVVWENNQKVRRKLTDKDTYRSYPQRMLQMRARGFVIKDAFGDVTKGLTTREEAQDLPETEAPETNVTPSLASASDLMPKREYPAGAVSPVLVTTEGNIVREPVAGTVDAGTPASTGPVTITETERRRLFAVLRENGKTPAALKTHLLEKHKIEKSTQITVGPMFDAVLRWAGPVASREPGQEG